MKVVQILTPNYSNVSPINEIELASGEKMTLIQVLIGKIENDFQISATLDEGAKLEIYTAIIARENSRFNYNYIVEHLGANSQSIFRMISALTDDSIKNTRMQLHFCKGATGSNGSEKESVVLSGSAHNVSLPIILCDEENVVGNHSLSTGHIDANQLQYLSTRGFDEAQARDIIVRAQILDVLNLITDDEKSKVVLDALNT